MRPPNRTSDGDRAVIWQLAARCLSYPDHELISELPLLRATAAELHQPPPRLVDFLDHAAAVSARELAEHYVSVFEFKNRRSLYLSRWTDGDTRPRSSPLVDFKETCRRRGQEFTDGDPPDFLPAVLELAATGDAGPLLRYRPAVELLRFSLTDAGTPYAGPVTAVCAKLPGASPRDRAAAQALASRGPATETVGPEPFDDRGPSGTPTAGGHPPSGHPTAPGSGPPLADRRAP